MNSELFSFWGFSWWHLGAVALVLLAGIVQVYRWTLAPITPRQRLAMMSLRLVWVLALLWCLWGPVLEKTQRHAQAVTPKAMVLVDVSESMGFVADDGADRWKSVLKATGRLNAMLKDNGVQDVQWMALGQNLRPLKESPQPTDKRSEIVSQVQQAAAMHGGEQDLFVFLLSDGDDTSRTTAGEAIASLNQAKAHVFPILPDGLSKPQGIARIDAIEAPSQARPKERFEVAAKLRVRQSSSRTLTLKLLDGDRELARRDVNPSGDGVFKEPFAVQVEQAGSRVYTLQLADAAGKELSRARTCVNVCENEKLRVLYVQGTLDWECRFVRQAINENPSITMDVMTRVADDSWFVQSSAGSPRLIGGNPLVMLQEALKNIDVIVLANVSAPLLDRASQEALLAFVRKQGGGILFINGNAGQASSFKGSLLEELLPVAFADGRAPEVQEDQAMLQLIANRSRDLNSAEEEYARGAVKRQGVPLSNLRAMKLTPQALTSGIWADASGKGPALAQPPATFLGSARVRAVKPAATVLAVHPAEMSGKDPMALMAVQPIGGGRSGFIGADAMWRWRLGTQSQVRDYDRFWQQLLMWLSASKTRTGIQFDRGLAEAGQPLGLTLTVKSAGAVKMVVTGDDGKQEDVALSWSADGLCATGSYKPQREGELNFTASQGGKLIAQQMLPCRITSLEQEYCSLNEPLLAYLARETQGQILNYDDIDSVSKLLKGSTITRTQRELIPLWHSSTLFAFMLGCYGGELLLRRKYRLV